MTFEFFENTNPSATLKVDGHFVWDYKIKGDQIRLISEPVPGSDEYEKVTVGEIQNYLGFFQDFVIYSETDDTELTENRIEVCN